MTVLASERFWLALVIGNTRLHWAIWEENYLHGIWHTCHLQAPEVARLIYHHFAPSSWRSLTSPTLPVALEQATRDRHESPGPLPLYLASVVPEQSALWQSYPGLEPLTLDQIPLQKLYPTLGIDRALNLLGAGDRYGWPALVIDAGTAITLTTGNAHTLLGGAILPGLSLQFQALHQHTAQLPLPPSDIHLPERWATTTTTAIQSGIIYGAVATIRDFITAWQDEHPGAVPVLTGGDGDRFWEWLSACQPSPQLHYDPDLVFWGIQYCRQFRAPTSH